MVPVDTRRHPLVYSLIGMRFVQPLRLSAADALECHIKFYSTKIMPAMRPFVKIP